MVGEDVRELVRELAGEADAEADAEDDAARGGAPEDDARGIAEVAASATTALRSAS